MGPAVENRLQSYEDTGRVFLLPEPLPTDALPPPQLMGIEQQWANHVDLLGLRLDRRLSFVAHTARLRERLGPKTLDLRRWTWAF